VAKSLQKETEIAVPVVKTPIAAGHELTYRNVGAVANINEITEFSIGHNIIAHAVFVGLERAVREMREAIKESGEAISS
jgi:pyridoxine 5'-phosphate synthase PdxJ